MCFPWPTQSASAQVVPVPQVSGGVVSSQTPAWVISQKPSAIKRQSPVLVRQSVGSSASADAGIGAAVASAARTAMQQSSPSTPAPVAAKAALEGLRAILKNE